MKKILLIILVGLIMLDAPVFGQVPAPASSQSKPILLKGATLHIGNGEVIQNGYLAFDNGKITHVGSQTVSDESKYDVRNVKGKHIYPGFVLLSSVLGLEEVESISAMADNSEQGIVNPNVRAQIAYNTDSENIPAFRFNGVLYAETTQFEQI